MRMSLDERVTELEAKVESLVEFIFTGQTKMKFPVDFSRWRGWIGTSDGTVVSEEKEEEEE